MTIPPIRRLEEIDTFDRLTLVEMSYSRINNYTMCPAKYFYSSILQAPWTFGAPAALGNIVHEVLELHVGEEDDLRLAELLLTFEQVREKYDPDRLIDDELWSAGSVMLSEFVDRHDGETINVVAREQHFQFVIGNVLLRGYIDRVDELGPGQYRIIDYKTGKYQEAQKHIHNNLQLGIYFLATMLNHPDATSVRGDLYYLRSGKCVGHTYTPDEVERVQALVWSQLNEILADRYFHYTDNGRICSFCDHAEAGTCSRGVAVRRRMRRT